MIAVDTNVLVHSHRNDSPFYAQAFAAVAGLAESGAACAIPWPCLHEFFSIATHPRIYRPPSTFAQVSRQIDVWMTSPTLLLLYEGPAHWSVLHGLIASARLIGGQVHDARIAAICLEHRVRELWSADRDFKRFPTLRVRNPLFA